MTATTLTLTDFLLARIAEDEAVAGEMAGWCGEWRCQPSDAERGAVKARVLAECEAKRAIVALHSAYPTPQRMVYGTITACEMCGSVDDSPVEWPCPTLRALAAIYADHEDYREEWRP